MAGRTRTPGAGACEEVDCGGEMTTVASEAAIGLPFSSEIASGPGTTVRVRGWHHTVGRKSSRRLRLPSAVTVRLASLSRLRERHDHIHMVTGRVDSDHDTSRLPTAHLDLESWFMAVTAYCYYWYVPVHCTLPMYVLVRTLFCLSLYMALYMVA